MSSNEGLANFSRRDFDMREFSKVNDAATADAFLDPRAPREYVSAIPRNTGGSVVEYSTQYSIGPNRQRFDDHQNGYPLVHAASSSNEAVYMQSPVPVPDFFADESSNSLTHDPCESPITVPLTHTASSQTIPTHASSSYDQPDYHAQHQHSAKEAALPHQKQSHVNSRPIHQSRNVTMAEAGMEHREVQHLIPHFNNSDAQNHGDATQGRMPQPDQQQHVSPPPPQQQHVSPAPPQQHPPLHGPVPQTSLADPTDSRHVRFDPNTQTPTPSAGRHTRKRIIPRNNASRARASILNYQQQQHEKREQASPQHQQQQQQQQDPQSLHQQYQKQPPQRVPKPLMLNVYDVLIIGGGVVGLAVLRAATLAGFRCCLIEAEADLLRGASSANSGIVCTGVDAAAGTLERALIRDSISQVRPFLKSYRIPHRDCGSLVCQWEWDGVNREKKYQSPLAMVLAESHDAGDANAKKLNGDELGHLEPNVSPLCAGAVYIPGEIVVDSWLYSIALAAHARENGAQIHNCFEYDASQSWFDEEHRVWHVFRSKTNDHMTAVHSPELLHAKAIVNATGIFADVVQAATDGVNRPHWKAIPRRGQYRVFMADDCSHVLRPIQPVPSQRTKGIFIYSSLYDHIVVGPTAEDQESRIDRTINPAVADALTSFALRIIPDLDPHRQYIGEFVGIRPATDHRDYQICMTPQRNWIVAAGIRSTGLTASLGIGRHITELLKSILPSSTPLRSIRTTPLPAVTELAKQYNSNHDGNVLIHGYLYRVTHPLTQMGFKMKSGIASDAARR